jgi:putative FmdB family regulatory protein
VPIFQYECASGEAHQFEHYLHTREQEEPLCPSCGSAATRIWKITKRSGYHRYPFKTKNITGYEVEVTDESHENALIASMREQGREIVQRDDVAWIDEEYVGYDPRSGKQVYRQGSGRGLPGQWIAITGLLFWLSQIV